LLQKNIIFLIQCLSNFLNKIINKKDKNEYWDILQTTNELVVKTTKTKLKTIEQTINNINSTALKQVAIKVAVYEIDLNKKNQYGVNWGYVNKVLDSQQNLKKVVSFSSNSNIPSLDTKLSSPTIFKYSKNEGISSLVKLLNNFGTTILSYKIPLITTNNIPAIYNLSNKIGYVSKFTLTTDNTNSTNNQISIEQDNVSGGEYLYLKPTIFKNQLLMSVKMVFSTINGIVRQDFGNGQYIQTPNLSKNIYNQNIVLNNGDKIIIGGITQKTNRNVYSGLTNDKTIFSPLFGVKNKNKENKEIVIVIEAKTL